MSETKSAIDEIFKISENMNSVSSSIKILEKSIKSLNSKFIILTKKVDAIEEKMEANYADAIQAPPLNMPMAKPPGGNPGSNQNFSQEETNGKLVLGAIKTYGYIVNKERVPIPNIKVAIFDKDEDKIRGIKTNSDGYWEARLPNGVYKIIYSHEKFNDIIKEIEIPKDSVNFRVT